MVAGNRGAVDKVIQIERTHPIGKARRKTREPNLVLPPCPGSGFGRLVPYVSRDEAIEISLQAERQVQHGVVARQQVGEEHRIGPGFSLGSDVVRIEEGSSELKKRVAGKPAAVKAVVKKAKAVRKAAAKTTAKTTKKATATKKAVVRKATGVARKARASVAQAAA